MANQRNNLANVAHEMDGLLQFNIDRMMFFAMGMQAALEQPLDIDVLRIGQPTLSEPAPSAGPGGWRYRIGVRCRCLASQAASLVTTLSCWWTIRWRLINPMATLGVGLSAKSDAASIAISPSGCSISLVAAFLPRTLPLRDESQVITHHSQAPSAPWFTRQTQRNNPGRGVIWQTFPDDDPQLEEQVVTASIPLDFLPVTGVACWRWISQSAKSKRFWLAPCRGDKRESTNFMIAI
ncbi:hypothetical protein MJ588_18650 [Klebsiella pneumoniae]|nr:hypothetical protein MJ588_18650 [Klebsiella pneumoniae]